VLSAKLDQLRLDGDLHNFAGFAAAADIINAGDEFTKRPGSFRGIIFHNVKRIREGRIDAMGCVPHLCFGELGIGLTFRAVGGQLGAEPETGIAPQRNYRLPGRMMHRGIIVRRNVNEAKEE